MDKAHPDQLSAHQDNTGKLGKPSYETGTMVVVKLCVPLLSRVELTAVVPT